MSIIRHAGSRLQQKLTEDGIQCMVGIAEKSDLIKYSYLVVYVYKKSDLKKCPVEFMGFPVEAKVSGRPNPL